MRILLALLLLVSTAHAAFETGPADSVMRIPASGSNGRGKYGSIDLSKAAAVGSSILPIANGGTGTAALLDEPVQMINATITPSVAANALTLALKNKAGNDPSSGDPVKMSFRSSTLTSGAYVQRTVTGALSLVISSGSTLGHSSGAPSPIYVYFLDNAGTVELAAGSSPVDERALQSTTAEGGAGAADSNIVLYSTTARSNVAVKLFAILQVTEATAGTWLTAPSSVALDGVWPVAQMQLRPGGTSVGIGGYAISSSSGAFTTTSTSLVDVTNLSVTIVTTGRPVKLEVVGSTGITNAYCYVDNTASSHTQQQGFFAFNKDGSDVGGVAIGGGVASTNSTTFTMGNCPSYRDQSPTPGSHTYKFRAQCSSGVCSNVSVNSMVLVAYEL